MNAIYHLLDEAESFSERDGGAISRWAANVLREGEEIIICPTSDETWKFDDRRVYVLPRWKDADPIHPVLYRLPWLLQKKAYIRIFRVLLSKLRPGDLVYVHNRPACASALATVAKQYRFNVVLHMHNSLLLRANQGQLKALSNTPIVFCSEFLREEVHSTLPGYFTKTFVVRNGADPAKFHVAGRVPTDVPRIIFTGRLVPYKGVHILVEAMHILKKRGVAATCQIVGGAGFGSRPTTRYVRRLHRSCPSNTEMMGYKAGDELAALLRRADIFCCPSIWSDPFPLAPLEAMASGLPVVASRTGGLPETLAYGGGVLVPPADAESLATAIQDLVEDPERRKQLSNQAVRAFQEHFRWNNVRDQYRNVIDKVVSCA